MRAHKQCLNCVHYVPEAHDGWKPNAWALDEPYDLHDLRNYMEKGFKDGPHRPHPQHGWPGACRLNPVEVEVRSVYVCGQWSANELMLHTWGDWVASYHRGALLRQTEEKLKEERKRSLARFHALRALRGKNGTDRRAAEAEEQEGSQP